MKRATAQINTSTEAQSRSALFSRSAAGFGLLLLAFFLPFERLGALDVAGITVRPSQLVVLLSIAAVIGGVLARKERSIPRNPLFFPLAFFFVIALVGLFSAPNIDRSITVLAFQVFTCSIAFLVPFQLRTPGQLPQLLKWLLVGTAVVTAFGLFQFVGDWIGLPTSVTGLRDLYTKEILGFPRVQSTALEPLYFANYLLIPLSVLLTLALRRKKVFPQWIVVTLLALVSVNFVLTVARGAYIAAVPTIAIIIGYHVREVLRPRVLGAAFAIGLLGLVALIPLAQNNIVSVNFARHVTNLFDGASYVERVDMFAVALDAWERHPIVGIGPGSFGPFQAPYAFEPPREGWKIVNNEYLELLAENGVLGLLTMFVVFAIVCVRSAKAVRHTRSTRTQKATATDATTDTDLTTALLVAFTAAFVGILVQYNTFSVLYIVHIWFVIGVLIALQNMVLSERS